MIPKTIHYCWFGRNPMLRLEGKCILSWKKNCPDYEIVEWNEDNFDLAPAPLYVRQAYEAGKWAFVTDYVRLWAVHQYGGIYLDTDVEVIRSLDPFLGDDAFFGFEDQTYVATGLGFGAIAGHPLLRELMADYKDIPFIREDGSFDTTPCPMRNIKVFLKHGLVQDGSEQMLNEYVHIYPKSYFCPLDCSTRQLRKTRNTATIHWFSASWFDEVQKKQRKRRIIMRRIDRVAHFPNRLAKTVLGSERYGLLKRVLRR